jgi:hypothetical protein
MLNKLALDEHRFRLAWLDGETSKPAPLQRIECHLRHRCRVERVELKPPKLAILEKARQSTNTKKHYPRKNDFRGIPHIPEAIKVTD